MISQHDIIGGIRQALAEDIGTGDVTSQLLPADLNVHAQLISREPMLVCGQPWVDGIFAEIDPNVSLEWQVIEGTWLDRPQTLCHIYGAARSILTAERTALNFMQTLSATATQTHYYQKQIQEYKTRLLDTRKTIPGLRVAQKYAVATAGGTNHRFGLHDAFLIKENHIKACGSIREAIKQARLTSKKGLLVEVEVESLDELREALDAKPDRVLLDNFSVQMLTEAVSLNQPKSCELEASGGIDLTSVKAIAQTGVDYISVGAITKSIQAIDLSLLIKDEV